MKKVVFIGLCCLVFFHQVNGQDSTKRFVLTFDQAIRLALNNAILLNTQKNNLELSQMQKTASIVGLLPSLSTSATASRTSGNSFNPVTGEVVNGIRDNFSANVSGSINLFSGFYQQNTIRQYMNLLDGQSYFVKRTAQDAMNTVATQYLNVMLDKELLIIAKTNLTTLEKQLEQIQGQVDLGSKSPVDGYNQRALTKAAELSWVQAAVQLDNDKALLAQTLLMDPFEEFDAELPNWDVNSIGAEIVDPGKMAEEAKLNRGDYIRAIKNEYGYRYGMRAALGNMMPSFYMSGTIGSAYNFQHGVPATSPGYQTVQTIVTDPTAASGYSIVNTQVPITIQNEPQLSFKEQFKVLSLYKQVGFGMNLRLFNGFQNRLLYVTAKVTYENAIQTRKNVEFQIKNDVVRAVKNFNGAKQAFVITSDKLIYAEKAMELETQRFDLGVTSFVEYANANKVLVQAQTDKAQAEFKLVFQKITLAYSTGTLRSEDVTAQDNN